MQVSRGSKTVIALSFVTCAAAWLTSGCAPITVPVPVELGGDASFDVVAGTPARKTFASEFSDEGPTIGSGSVEIDPAALSLNRAAARVTGVATCGAACDVAGVSEDTCNAVCNLGQVSVTVWIGLAGVSDVFTNGDMYGPFLVTLSGEDEGVMVEPNTVDFSGMTTTLQAFEERAATFGVEIISPEAGTVVLDSLTINAGL